MSTTLTPASDLERRKQVRLRIRGDITITPQKYEGRTFYVVKDPVSLRYYRFKEQEHFLIRLMDGKHTLDDAQKEFEARFRPDRLTLEDLEQFGQQLLKAGLVQNESPQAGKLLYEQRTKRVRSQLMQTFTNILYIKIPVFDPEKLLVRMLPYCRFIFTLWFLLLSVVVMLWALLLVGTHFETFRERLPSFHEFFFNFKTVIYLWIALGVVKVIHEFGHGLSCKTFGGEVHEMGFLLLCLSPAMYCNVSDAWTLPNKWHRIIISAAGIYVELMIAALATFVWWNTPGQPFINYMALSLMFVCSVSTVMFNGNPLMRYDGYYVLADWLEIPNLREKANRYLQRLSMEYCLGIETQPEPYMDPLRRMLFLTYAIVSYLYRWFVTFVIIYFMATFLKPYKLQVLSQVLAMFAVGSMVGWPVYRLLQNVYKRGRLPDMKFVNASISAAVLAALLLGFFLAPLPISRIRETGVVQLQPQASSRVPILVDGILHKIHVREGEQVRRGKILAEFKNQEVLAELEAAQTRYRIQDEIIRALNAKIPSAKGKPELAQKLHNDLVLSREEKNKAELEWQQWQEKADKLVLRAPCDGVAIGVPKRDEIGKRWEKDRSEAFCTIGDPDKLQVLLPISPDDQQLLRVDMLRASQEKRTLEVTIRVQGLGARTWSGVVPPAELPTAAAKEIPLALSTKGGGPLAVKPGAESEKELVPQVQVYLVPVYFTDPDSVLVPGALAQVKIHCEYRSAAWWTWRAISKTFDLGLV